jgi:hypothetical protein
MNGMLAREGRALSFGDYAERCTSEADLPGRFRQLLQELDAGIEVIRVLGRSLSLDVWIWTRNEWWFDEAYLGVDLTAVDSAFRNLEEYSGLARPRGHGHIVEQWIAANIRFESFSPAREILRGLSRGGAST